MRGKADYSVAIEVRLPSLLAENAGGSPAMSTARCDGFARQTPSVELFALRAHGWRAACGPRDHLRHYL